jgi:hypothetical protein
VPSEFVPLLKVTVPVGMGDPLGPVTLAVNVTDCPAVDVEAESDSAVVDI